VPKEFILQNRVLWSAEVFFQGGLGMEGKNRFTSRQINKALQLLRDLPVKDGRKSAQEALRRLEQGMREAQEKGYSQGDIRETIAEAEVIVSATTLKTFLGGKKKNSGQKQSADTVKKTEKPGQQSEVQTVKKTENSGRQSSEEMEENYSPGSIIIKPDTPRDEL
jgi:hypothetical protein